MKSQNETHINPIEWAQTCLLGSCSLFTMEKKPLKNFMATKNRQLAWSKHFAIFFSYHTYITVLLVYLINIYTILLYCIYTDLPMHCSHNKMYRISHWKVRRKINSKHTVHLCAAHSHRPPPVWITFKRNHGIAQKKFHKQNKTIFRWINETFCSTFSITYLNVSIKLVPTWGIILVFMWKINCVALRLGSRLENENPNNNKKSALKIVWNRKSLFFIFLNLGSWNDVDVVYVYCVFTSICESFLLIDPVCPVLCTEFIVGNNF